MTVQEVHGDYRTGNSTIKKNRRLYYQYYSLMKRFDRTILLGTYNCQVIQISPLQQQQLDDRTATEPQRCRLRVTSRQRSRHP